MITQSGLIREVTTNGSKADQMRVLFISGSNAQPAHTVANLRLVEELLEKHDARAKWWDLHRMPLPTHDPIYHHDPYTNKSQSVRRLAALADWADAFVLASPVYHGSFSGVLKNALDNLTSRQFRRKPVALISNGGVRGGTQPCDQLRLVVRALQGVAIPTQVATADADFELREGRYVLVNTEVRERFGLLTEELALFARALKGLRLARVAR